ncbi:MAG: hypothetical protein J07HQX50_02525 [Haloquadratum sp. J07HQX50]|jgi:hypothetical protein|nr:MAG: hypothetical protein J07HQX50_02525 [Haloquadratum sp. J07HQX50]
MLNNVCETMSQSIDSQTASTTPVAIVECDPETIEPTDSVTHVDQLPTHDRERIVEAIDAEVTTAMVDSVQPGTVIRYTSYYKLK